VIPGTKLGPYEIVAPIGAGGMGEVYRARDTKLNRDVAIKVLPEAFAADADRLARFTREAQVLASLNHPNIAQIYGIESGALVMELVEGEDLSDVIAREAGSKDPAYVLPIARQIADALEAAHEQGVVHRDLKPANVKVKTDGSVKVLDFGLAKAADPGGSSISAMNSPTMTTPANTAMGMILGTAAYMSPEQAKGRAVDKRADIWAFGAVLYEMLAGRRAFDGDGVSEILASVLKDKVDFDALPPSVPPRLRALVERCLERDVKLRLRDIGEARLELAKVADGRGELSSPALPRPASARASLLPWAVAAVAIIAAAYFGWAALGTAPASVSAVSQHLQLNLDPDQSLLGSDPTEIRAGSRRPSRTAIALSPNGHWLAYTAEQKGAQQLFLRDMRRGTGAAVPGTVGADNPFFSPDGKQVGFWSNGALRRVPVDGGPVVEICKTGRVFGASWGPGGRILFALLGSTIQSVSADGGGAVSAATEIDTVGDELGHRLPHWISDDRFLYVARVGNTNRLVVQRIDGTDRRVLMDDATDGRVVAGGTYLVFMREATLMAVPFDRGTATVTGAAQGAIDGVMVSLNAPNTAIDVGAGEFTVSDAGTLVYLPGQMFVDVTGTLTWLDRQGRTHPVAMESRGYSAARLSHDDRYAVSTTIARSGNAFWIHDFDRGTTEKVPFDGTTQRAIWTPDSRAIVFSGSRAQDRGLYRTTVGSGAIERLPGGVRVPSPAGWARDGREVVYVENVRTVDGGTGTDDIYAVSLDDNTSRPLVQTKGRDSHPAVSPDGRWLAYASDESSKLEVLVQAYDGDSRVTISHNGGHSPRWTRDGKTLIYSKQIPDPNNADRVRFEMWEVPLTFTSRVVPGRPRQFADLSQEEFGTSGPVANYDVAKDGRILGTTREFRTPPPGRTLHVITNWFEDLRAKSTAKK
jgi:serine/threonine protein kinase/Tol biopolymer transport system component